MARRSDKFIARNVFYIITNGAQTECNYFKSLIFRICTNRLFFVFVQIAYLFVYIGKNCL